MSIRPKITNLIIEGGGVKGVCAVGVTRYLSENGYLDDLQRVGGASVGSINGLLVGLNYSYEESLAIFRSLNLNHFLDTELAKIGNVKNLIKNYGFYSSDRLVQFFGELVKRKTGNPNSTFADIEKMKYERGFLDMYFLTSDLSTGRGILPNVAVKPLPSGMRI